jgi:hypothetical protein
VPRRRPRTRAPPSSPRSPALHCAVSTEPLSRVLGDHRVQAALAPDRKRGRPGCSAVPVSRHSPSRSNKRRLPRSSAGARRPPARRTAAPWSCAAPAAGLRDRKGKRLRVNGAGNANERSAGRGAAAVGEGIGI